MTRLLGVVGLTALWLASAGSTSAEPLGRLPALPRAAVYQPETRTVVFPLALKGVAFVSLGALATAPEVRPEWPTLAAASLPEGRLLLADRFGRLRLLAPGADGQFQQLQEWSVDGIPTGLTLREELVLLSAGPEGLQILELQGSAPNATLQLRARFPFVDYSKEVALARGPLLLLADNYETGMQVLRLDDPQRPQVLAVEQHDFIDAVASLENLAAAGSRSYGTLLFDLTVPEKPRHLLTIPLLLPAGDQMPQVRRLQFLADGRLLITEGLGGARLFRLAPEGDRLTAALVGTFPARGGGAADALALPDGRVLVTDLDGVIHLEALP